MTVRPIHSLLGYLRRQVTAPAELTDRQLLQRFTARHDEAAFEALLQRHGPLVWGVCRRVLPDEYAAEDAFQAAFLVLAQKAGSIRNQTALSSWLHGVAYRLALKARARSARHLLHERQAAATSRREPTAEADPELRAVLDEELGRLPDRYRAPLLLCYYQGKTNEQAAEVLGWPAGSISKRLARGRELLRQRLTRRGVTAPAALLAAALAGASEAALPPALPRLTTAAALAAARGQGEAPAGPAALAQSLVQELSAGRTRALLAASLLLGVLAVGFAAVRAVWAERAPAAAVPPPAAAALPAPREKCPAPVDQLADPLPPGAVARLGTTRLRHGRHVYAIAFSPDGKALASAALRKDNVVILWDTATGKELRRFRGHQEYPVTVAFAPDGKTLTAGGADGTLRVWDAATGKERHWLLGGWHLAYSPDSKLLAVVEVDRIGLWDMGTGKRIRSLLGYKGVAGKLAFAPDGKLLAAAGGHDKAVWLWDVATGKPRPPLRGHTGRVNSVAFTPDGKALVSGSDDQTIRFWDTATGKEVRRLTGPDNRVSSVAFSPDGKKLAVGRFRALQVWDVAAGKEIRTVHAPDGMDLTGVFSPDGKTLAAAGGEGSFRLRLWDADTGAERCRFVGHEAPVRSVLFTPDGKRALTAGDDGTARLWETATGRELRQLRLPANFRGDVPLALSPDGRTLAVCNFQDVILTDFASGKELRYCRGHRNRLYAVAFSPDGKRLATAAADRTVRIWEAATGKPLYQLEGHADDARCVAFSPDGKLLATGGEEKDRAVCLWDVQTGKRLRRLTGHTAYVVCVAFSANGKILASSAADGTVRLWDVAAGKEWHRLEGDRLGQQPQVPSLAFAPDGRTLLLGKLSGAVELWEVASGALRHRFAGHLEAVHAVAFSPNGRTVASASTDTTALLWDVSGRAGALRREQLSDKELEALWLDLRGPDAVRAHRAIWRLVAAPGQAVDYLRKQLNVPAEVVSPARLRKLLAELGDRKFRTREQALAQLAAFGELAEPALREALAGKPADEVERRVGRLLERLEQPGGRAVEVLEQIGTRGARQLLQTLARGPAESRRTQAARAAVGRLQRRSP